MSGLRRLKFPSPTFLYLKGELMHNISREEAKKMIGIGWSKLIDKIYDKLPEDTYVLQVKEKFGGLRFYVGYISTEIQNFIDEVEDESYSICEECGKKGKLREDLGWMLTLCDEHYEEKLNKNS
jgi:hypothetical protein